MALRKSTSFCQTKRKERKEGRTIRYNRRCRDSSSPSNDNVAHSCSQEGKSLIMETVVLLLYPLFIPINLWSSSYDLNRIDCKDMYVSVTKCSGKGSNKSISRLPMDPGRVKNCSCMTAATKLCWYGKECFVMLSCQQY